MKTWTNRSAGPAYGHAVFTVVLIENSQKVFNVWLDLRDRTLPELLKQLKGVNPHTRECTLVASTSESVNSLPSYEDGLQDLLFNTDNHNTISPGRIWEALDHLSSINGVEYFESITRHLVILAASTPREDSILPSFSPKMTWKRVGERITQDHIHYHLVSTECSNTMLLSNLFENVLHDQGNVEVPPSFPTCHYVRLSALAVGIGDPPLQIDLPARLPTQMKRNNTFPELSALAPVPVLNVRSRANSVRHSTASSLSGSSDLSEPPTLIQQLQRVHGVTTKKKASSASRPKPFFLEAETTDAREKYKHAPVPLSASATAPKGRTRRGTAQSRRGSQASSPESNDLPLETPNYSYNVPASSLSSPITPLTSSEYDYEYERFTATTTTPTTSWQYPANSPFPDSPTAHAALFSHVHNRLTWHQSQPTPADLEVFATPFTDEITANPEYTTRKARSNSLMNATNPNTVLAPAPVPPHAKSEIPFVPSRGSGGGGDPLLSEQLLDPEACSKRTASQTQFVDADPNQPFMYFKEHLMAIDNFVSDPVAEERRQRVLRDGNYKHSPRDLQSRRSSPFYDTSPSTSSTRGSTASPQVVLEPKVHATNPYPRPEQQYQYRPTQAPIQFHNVNLSTSRQQQHEQQYQQPLPQQQQQYCPPSMVVDESAAFYPAPPFYAQQTPSSLKGWAG